MWKERSPKIRAAIPIHGMSDFRFCFKEVVRHLPIKLLKIDSRETLVLLLFPFGKW